MVAYLCGTAGDQRQHVFIAAKIVAMAADEPSAINN